MRIAVEISYVDILMDVEPTFIRWEGLCSWRSNLKKHIQYRSCPIFIEKLLVLLFCSYIQFLFCVVFLKQNYLVNKKKNVYLFLDLANTQTTPRRYLAYTAAFSRKHTLQQVYDFLCSKLRFCREDIRLWKISLKDEVSGSQKKERNTNCEL